MRFRTTLAAVAVPALLIAACGSDDDTDTEADDDTVAEEPTDEADDADDEAAEEPADDGGTLTIYSGRSEELVGPVIEQFEAASGVTVEVRYGDTAEMATQILDEGDNSPADVFFGQDAGALGALSAAGVLAPLPDGVLDSVDEQYRSVNGEWVGVSGRARVAVYNTDDLSEDELPDQIAGFTDPEWAGRVGWAPTNASFQAFVTALRVLEGEDAARDWLEAMRDNDAQVYDGNGAILDAVAAGEVEVGLVNHYYLYPRLAEQPDLPVANKYYTDGDPGALVNVAGTAVLQSSADSDVAVQFIEYLLSDEGQTYFTEETWEFPLVAGIEPLEDLPDLASVSTPPDIDLSQLEDLEGTLALLQETGVL